MKGIHFSDNLSTAERYFSSLEKRLQKNETLKSQVLLTDAGLVEIIHGSNSEETDERQHKI